MNVRSGLAVAVLSVAACSSGGNVTFSARGGGSSPPATALVVGGAGGVTIDEVQLVVRRVRLERTASDGSSHEEELSVGPFVIDLKGSQLDAGALAQVFDADVPPGTYGQVKFEVHRVEDADVAARPALAPLAGKSFVVTGSYQGAPFTFSSSLDEEQEREGLFQVGTGTHNITLNLDVTRWFTGPGGTVLDPTLATNRSQIESNVKASIDAYEDDDRNGLHD
jgi:hypothetical protein